MTTNSNSKFTRLPSKIIWLIFAISILPFFLHILGLNFGNKSRLLDTAIIEGITNIEMKDAIFEYLSGAFTHLLLEWSSVIVAITTSALAFVQFRVTGNPATPIIGMALLCAGFMDAFHALSATKLIRSLADNENFIPFTWALSRMFNVLILMVGSGIFLLRFKNPIEEHVRNRFVLLISTLFLVVSFGIVHLCALSQNLPQTMYTNSLIKRPFDVAPLLLFVLLALWVLPKFYQREKSVFAHALMYSMLPAIATQLHMAFGSFELFDAHFNIAHFLKMVSYIVPFSGLAIDYIYTYKEEQKKLMDIEAAHQQLKVKNKELEQFAYVASHDLQEPLRTVNSFVELLKRKYEGQLDQKADKYIRLISEASNRMSNLIKALLDYSRIGRNKKLTVVDCNQLLNDIQKDLSVNIAETNTSIDIGELPQLNGYETELRLLFQNLINNAIKFRKQNTNPIIKINAIEENGWTFSVQDNGIGFAEDQKEKIFTIFQRLHDRSKYEGTGIGLAHCMKIVELHDGDIWVDSLPNKGSTFYIRLPKLKDINTIT